MDINSKQYRPAANIANYLCFGSKPLGEQTLGFELEHFVVKRGSRSLVPFCTGTHEDGPSVEELLQRLKPFYEESGYESDTDGSSYLFSLLRDRVAITLEPGAQLEISIGPAHSIKEIAELYEAFRKELDPILDELNLELVESGYHPTAQAREIPLLPKSRYRFMNEHFAQTGKHGICMMRATASTQVSVDFKDQADALKKFKIANALGPLFAFITDNTPVFEAESIGLLSGDNARASSGLEVPKRMARMSCWDDTDPDRCLIAPHAFEETYSFKQYAETLFTSPAIFLPPKDASAQSEYLAFKPFGELLPNEELDEEMILHILSMFFYDARFKSYLELRQADSLPLDYALSFVALVCGIFYNETALDTYTQLFSTTEVAAVAEAKAQLREKGYEALVYGRKASEWLEEMVLFAKQGLSEADLPYLEPLATLVHNKKTPLEVL